MLKKNIFFDSKCGICGDSWEEICDNYNDTPDNAANDMHDKVVSELIDKIKEQYNSNLTETIRDIHDKVAKEMYCKGIDDLIERLNRDIDRISEELKE